MPSTYKCTGCDDVFETKTERNNHFRNDCKMSVSLTDSKSAIHLVERIDDKFLCPQCPKRFTRSDNLKRHWKVCMMKDGTESNESPYDKI